MEVDEQQREEASEPDWSWADEAEQQVLRHLHIHQHTQKTQEEGKDLDADTTHNDRRGMAGPTMVWPLGEIIMARHDFQHTRIFNS